MVGRHYKNGVPRNERPLDRSEGWEMEDESIRDRVQGLSGAHTGENLGRYAVGLLDRVGIMNNTESKVNNSRNPESILTRVSCQLYTATLDNTGNNNTTCKTIETIHNRRGLVWNSEEQQLPYVTPS
jgi:hypothetical protein